MNDSTRTILITGLLIVLIALPILTWWWFSNSTEVEPISSGEITPNMDEAETTGFGFVLDILQLAQRTNDYALQEKLTNSLTQRAQSSINEKRLLRDLLEFSGMQTTPESGVSVEDLQFSSTQEATLIVGLNYENGRELRAVSLRVEDGRWKVDAIKTISTYPPEEESELENDTASTTTEQTDVRATTTDSDLQPELLGACYVGGCSSQVCSDNPDVITDCAYRESYACYQTASCERQTDGQCGWTETPELLACMAEAEAI